MKDYFFIKHNGKIQKVKFEDIFFIESLKNYCKIYTKETSFLTLTTMKSLEEFLPGDAFIRIHKSYIISVNKIDQLTKTEVCMHQLKCLPVGETFRDKLGSFIAENLIWLTADKYKKSEAVLKKTASLFYLGLLWCSAATLFPHLVSIDLANCYNPMLLLQK
jgi:hypothetical protein